MLACALALPTPALSQQNYPAKPIRLIVPLAPGGPSDILARSMAQVISPSLGQTVVVDNRTGAGGTIGIDIAAKSPPDGYTMLLVALATYTITANLYSKLPYNARTDLTPVIILAGAPYVLTVHPSLPVKSLKELIALARSRPGQLNYASAGTGGSQHLAGEILKSTAKIDIVHVPYKGAAPAVVDMIGGHVSMGFTALPSSLPQARAGKLRPIAVTSVKRSEAAPDLPTFTELGFPQIDLVVWYGVLFPAKTPPEIVNRMSSEVARAVQSPDVKAKLLQQGVESIGTTPQQFASFMQTEIARYGKIIRDSGAKPD
jgi:tripartite-type tricarboxylate transporter receptor subunit TctC